MTVDQTNDSSELNADLNAEGDQSGEDLSGASTNTGEQSEESDLSDLFQSESKEEVISSIAAEKSKQGYFESQARSLKELHEAFEDGILDSYEYEEKKEEQLEKFPKMREALEKELKNIEVSKEIEELRKENESLKKKTLEEEKRKDETEAVKLLSAELPSLGISAKDFKEQYGAEFADIVAKRIKLKNDTRTEATEFALLKLSKKIKEAKENAKEDDNSVSVPSRRGTANAGFVAITNDQYLAMINAKDKRGVDAYKAESIKKHGKVIFK